MSIEIKKCAVLGAGVMGAQIAGHISNAGIPSLLFDMTRSISPSLSTSAAKTEYAASAEVVIVRAVKLGSAAPSFSYQAILSSL